MTNFVRWKSVDNTELNGGGGWSPCFWVSWKLDNGIARVVGGPMADVTFLSKEECDEFIVECLAYATHIFEETSS